MKREFSQREKVLLVIFVVMVLIVGYFKLILEPINNAIDDYQTKSDDVQTEIDQKMITARKVQLMEKEIERLKESDLKPIPVYSDEQRSITMKNLNQNLEDSIEQSLSFPSLISNDYIKCRPVLMTFSVSTYEEARAILDRICACEDTLMEISDLAITQVSNKTKEGITVIYQVSARLLYFEVDFGNK